jgi:hypothetical protein
MAAPASRQGLIDFCYRQLGYPVIDINVDDDQANDCVDMALQFFQMYHFDATEKMYLKHCVTQQDVDRTYIDMTQASGQAQVFSTNATVIGTGTLFSSEMSANVSQITINGETKTVVAVQDNSIMTVDSAFSADAVHQPITLVGAADSILSVTRIFPVSATNATVNMFDLRYQLRLHDLYDFTSVSYVNYTLTMQHLRMIEMLFSGENEVRFQRHQNKLHIDFQWGTDIQVGQFLIIEAYKILDPDKFTRIYNDWWLKRYTTQIIKRQWGTNLKKFGTVQLPGGVTLNGQIIYEEAQKEIDEIEEEVQSKFEAPPGFLVG